MQCQAQQQGENHVPGFAHFVYIKPWVAYSHLRIVSPGTPPVAKAVSGLVDTGRAGAAVAVLGWGMGLGVIAMLGLLAHTSILGTVVIMLSLVRDV